MSLTRTSFLSIGILLGTGTLLGPVACTGPGTPDSAPSRSSADSAAGSPAPRAVAGRTDSAPILGLVRERAVDTAIADYYGRDDATLLWVARDGPTPAADRLIDALRAVPAEGIDPASIGASRMTRALDAAHRNDPDPVSVARAELALTRGFMRLAGTLSRGSEARAESDVEWNLDRGAAPDAAVLARIPDIGVEEVLDSLRPAYPVYGYTVDALRRYRSRAESGEGWPRIGSAGIAEVGDSARIVAEVRARLEAGMVRDERRLAIRGAATPARMDPGLARAVALFQERHGLVVDSVVGAESVQALNIPITQRVQELELNLDRMRRMPSDLGDRAVLVNIAGFELQVLEDNRPVMEMDVIVGQPEWRTNVFRDSIDHLVVNPYWHVPETIEREETLPRAIDDPDYLARNDLSVVPDGDNFGDPIDRNSIDWSEVSIADFPHDFRQEPGPDNSLGRVKFMFPNEYSIYLHDTPADELFQKDFRAFSHGCVRVERPRELARYLLRTSSDRTPASLSEVMQSKDRTRIELDDPVPVYLTYLTTWVDEDGSVSFHQDPYDLDDTASSPDSEETP